MGSPSWRAAEEATAGAIYRALGAAPDVDRLAGVCPPGGLTTWEAEVLAWLHDSPHPLRIGLHRPPDASRRLLLLASGQ